MKRRKQAAARLERCRCPVKRFLRRAERRLLGKNIGRYIDTTSGEEWSKLRAMFYPNIGRSFGKISADELVGAAELAGFFLVDRGGIGIINSF